VNGVTTQYLVEDDVNPTGLPQVVEETVNGTVTRSYTYGLERISEAQPINGAWTPSFYEYDGAGSVRQLTNLAANVTVTDTYEYDAFGNAVNKTGATPNNYLSRDPEDGKPWDPKTLHKYLYAGGDPVNAIDPTGRGEEEYVIDLNEVQKWEVETGPTQLAKRLIACFMTISDALYMTVNHDWSVWGAGQDSVALYFCVWP